jgi:hypothetical protein
MAVNMIVETGEGLPNANSFASIAFAREYATNRGKSLPDDDDALAALLISAFDWIDSLEDRLKGVRTTMSQAGAFPRAGVYVNCVELADDEVPSKIAAASTMLAVAAHDGVDLMPNIGPDDLIKSERIGPIATEYWTGISGSPGQTNMTAVESLLKPFYKSLGVVAFGVARV